MTWVYVCGRDADFPHSVTGPCHFSTASRVGASKILCVQFWMSTSLTFPASLKRTFTRQNPEASPWRNSSGNFGRTRTPWLRWQAGSVEKEKPKSRSLFNGQISGLARRYSAYSSWGFCTNGSEMILEYGGDLRASFRATEPRRSE